MTPDLTTAAQVDALPLADEDPGAESSAAPRADPADSPDGQYLAVLATRDGAVRDVARWFRADHLPPEALHGEVARAFQAFALHMLDMIEHDSAQMELAMQKLLEAKDAAVRAAMS